MTHATVLNTLHKLAPEIRSKGAEETLIKYAKEEKLAPAVLEKMAQIWNTARTVNWFDKSADDRGATFDLIDVPGILTKYSAFKPASIVKSIPMESFKEASHRAPNLMTKAAGYMVKAAEEDAPLQGPQTYAKQQIEKRAAEQRLQQSLDEVALLQETLQDDLQNAAEKIAFVLREHGGDKLGYIERDMEGHFIGGTKSAFDWIEKAVTDRRIRGTKRASAIEDNRLVVSDRYGVLEEFTTIKEALELTAASRSYALSLQKEAAGTAVDVDDPRTKAKDNFDSTVAEHIIGPAFQWADKGIGASNTIAGDARAAIDSSQQAAGSIPNPLMELIQAYGPGSNAKQKSVDTAADEVRATTTLERLLATDKILSEADPAKVVSIYNSLRSVNPAMARDMNAVRFALREAVQYDGLPTHSYKDINSIGKDRAQKEQVERDNNSARYAVGKPNSPKSK